MRIRKAELKRRVNASLAFRFTDPGLTSFAGLELVRRYLLSVDFSNRIRRHLSGTGLDADFGLVGMVRLLLALMICGGRRLRHLMFLKDDPLVLRFCGLNRLPAPRTVSRWLGRFGREQVRRLLRVNEELVARVIRASDLRRLTIDVDGSVISTGMKVEWAFRGYNPHHRKVPSYYPVTAYEAQTGQILRVRNRPGNIHDGKASLQFLRDVFEQIRETLGKHYLLEFRMDGAFFRQDVIALLRSKWAEFAIRVPFFTWLDLKELIRSQPRWRRVNAEVSYFERHLWLEQWKTDLRVVIYRKKVQHRTSKNFQLDLFDPADGSFEYSAITTNKALNGKNLWYFLCGRGTHEKAYAELRSGFAFDAVPTKRYGANSAWQVLSVMAFNLMKGFQVATTAPRRGRSRKRWTLFALETIQSQRYHWLNRAGRLLSPDGVGILEVGTSLGVANRFMRMDKRLSEAV